LPAKGLHWLDFSIIGLYLAVMLGMGFYFRTRQKNAKEYLLAGRSVGWFAIGLSLLSSLNSALDYVVGPASFMEWGIVLSLGLPAIMLAYPVILKTFVPFYVRLPIYNCYEYLEQRFDLTARTTASAIFIVWRICWMGFTLYLPAYVLNVVIGLPLGGTIVALGVITTAYVAVGGARAVIWTDVVQAVIMFAGIVVSIFLLTSAVPDGLWGVWNAVKQTHLLTLTPGIPGWNQQASWWEKLSLYVHWPITVGSVVMANFIAQFNNYGSDQVMIQRYLSARSLEDCKKGFVVNAAANVFYNILFLILSMALLAYFRYHPLPQQPPYEYYFPHFIGFNMPVILKGFVLAAIYAAAQSSVSAGITAVTSVVYANFYVRLFKQRAKHSTNGASLEDERKQVWFSRRCALAFGAAVTTLAYLIQNMGGLFALANRIVSNFAGIMISVFLLGMFSRHARSLGVAIGAICGLAVQFVWGFGHELGLFERPLGYGWTSTVGLCTSVLVCYAISLFEKAPSPGQLQWLWKSVMSRPCPALRDPASPRVGSAISGV